MSIPTEFGGDLFLWCNDVVGRLNNANSKLAAYREDWSSLPTDLKTVIRGRMAAEIDWAVQELALIRAEIGALPDSSVVNPS